MTASSRWNRARQAQARSRFDEPLAQSREGLKRGAHAKAHGLCTQALALQPAEPRAVDVCAVAASNLRKAAQARGETCYVRGRLNSSQVVRMNPESIAEFHREALRTILSFLKARGVTTVEQLNEMKGRKLLAEPLWKLLELNGKYGGAYISEGVKLVEERLGKRVSASEGTWSSTRLDQVLGPVPQGSGWKSWHDAPEYSCHLEHVVEIRNIISALLTAPESLDAIVDNCLLGCVVLRSEHARLRRGELDIRDPWKRYRLASPEIRVWCRDSGDWVKLNPR